MEAFLENQKINSSSVDYSKSTEDNFASTEELPFVGKYGFLRQLLDYNYHNYYTKERQQLHDFLIDQSGETVIIDERNNKVCDKPAGGNWIVFTAGAFGAGKSHVLTWLSTHNHFPLHSFVVVDPDHLRAKLPETAEYIRRNPATSGFLTQKEVGYISEVMILRTLLEGKNVIVDGSLKDSEWYSQYMLKLRYTFPRLKLAIIHVTTSLHTAVARAEKRAAETGRVVPIEAIKEQLQSIPQSIECLKSRVDFVCTFRNENIPELIYTSTGDTSLSSFRDLWQMSCSNSENDDLGSCPENLDMLKRNNYMHQRLFFSSDTCNIKSVL